MPDLAQAIYGLPQAPCWMQIHADKSASPATDMDYSDKDKLLAFDLRARLLINLGTRTMLLALSLISMVSSEWQGSNPLRFLTTVKVKRHSYWQASAT